VAKARNDKETIPVHQVFLKNADTPVTIAFCAPSFDRHPFSFWCGNAAPDTKTLPALSLPSTIKNPISKHVYFDTEV
jgi:hypothetical protein